MNPEHQAMVRETWSAGQELTRRAETAVAAALFVIAFIARSPR